MQVRLDSGADECEQHLHRLSVQRPKIHRGFQKTQRHHRLRHMQDNWIANMRDGDAVANGRGFQGLARQQHLQQKLTVHLVRQPQHVDHTAKNGRLVPAGQTIENSTHLQGVGQFRKRRGAALRLFKNSGRDVDAIGGSPFQQLGPIEAILSTEPVTRQFPLVNPTINCLFRDIQQPGYIFDCQLHLLTKPKPPQVLWTSLDRMLIAVANVNSCSPELIRYN
jgi:hypothetical protein